MPSKTTSAATASHCLVCPRNCDVDRLANKTATCKTGRYARVASWFPHFGEEDCLRGWRGSGTIFLAWCNLRCVFCQNFDISQTRAGVECAPEEIAEMMLRLQDEGCHNINFVTPEHVVPQLLEALWIAIEAGLRLPIVYNTSAYDSLDSLHLLDGIVDIYMPDFKFWDAALALRYLKAKDYPEVARRVIQMPEMDGIEFLAHIRKNHPYVPVIVMTAFGNPELENWLRSLGVFAYIEKPIDFTELSNKILSALALKSEVF